MVATKDSVPWTPWNYRTYHRYQQKLGRTDVPFFMELPRVSDIGVFKEKLGMGDERLECIYDLPQSADDAFLDNMHIEELTTLLLVDLRGTKVTTASMEKLRSLHRLRYLYLDDTVIGDGAIPVLQSCTNLEVVSAQRAGITDKSLAAFSELRQLRDLVISGNSGITPSGLKTCLSQLQDLYSLQVSGIPLGDDAFSALPDLQDLSFLDASDTGVSDGVLPSIGAAGEDLALLYLRNNHITGEGLDSLQGNTQLWGVDLSGNPINEAGVKHLAHMPNLKNLSLNHVPVTPEMLQALEQCEMLDSLELRHSPGVTDATVRIVVQYPSLQRLDITGTQVTAEGIRYLCEHADHLECIILERSRITDEQEDELLEKTKVHFSRR